MPSSRAAELSSRERTTTVASPPSAAGTSSSVPTDLDAPRRADVGERDVGELARRVGEDADPHAGRLEAAEQRADVGARPEVDAARGRRRSAASSGRQSPSRSSRAPRPRCDPPARRAPRASAARRPRASRSRAGACPRARRRDRGRWPAPRSMLDSRSKPASGKGTPVQVRDGPAAVRGDASPPHATGLRAWEGGGEGSPESEDLSLAAHPEPLAEGGFVLRRSLVLLAVLVAAALSLAGRSRPRRSCTSGSKARPQTIFGATEPRVFGDERARRAPVDGAAPRSSIAHVTHSSFGPYVDQIGFYPGVGPGGLGLQGERRLAARRRRPGAAEGRRPRALVLRARSGSPAARRRSTL